MADARRPRRLGGIDETDARWLREKAVPNPLVTFEGRVWAKNPLAFDVPGTYVLCAENGMDPRDRDRTRQLAAEHGWDLHELETGHWPMVSEPAAVVERLPDAARKAE